MGKTFTEPAFTMEDVLNYLSVPFSGGTVNPKVVCPACGKKDFFFNRKTNSGHCFKCDFKGNQVSYLAKSLGVDNREARRIMGDKNVVASVATKKKSFDFPEPVNNADSKVSDKIYRELIKEHPLTKKALKNLYDRGLTDADISALNYGSIEGEVNANNIIKATNITPKGVAGFYDDGKWRVTKQKEGIVVPYYNEKREICGIQIRKICALKEDESKYTWLTSNGKPNGAKVAPCCHFAADWVYDTKTDQIKPLIRRKSILLTEGAMKADIAHMITGEPILAIAGVSNLGSLEQALDYVKAQGVVSVVDILDMDYLTNPHVQKAMEHIKEVIIAHGLQYTRRNWNVSPEKGLNLKGYDDYCVYMRKVGKIKKRD